MRLQAGVDAPPRAAGPALPERPAGELLAGRYRILRQLGRGAMGEVYAADDLEIGEPVALKILRPEIAADPEMLERFRREIQLARKVTHRNVCRLFDLCHHRESDGRDLLFLTMELLAGETLHDRIQRSGAMAGAEAAPIIEQAAAALAAAHQAGIVHRDFKSSNILLVTQEDGSTRAVVTDFGLARATSIEARLATLTRLDQIVGTPAYMAPEQVAGGEVTHAADLYALGIVMFEMLTGTLPFLGESALSTAVKRLHEPPPSPRVAVPDLDPRWERIVLRCLQRDPADRFASAADLLHALHGEAVAPGRGKAARRRRLAVAAAVGAVVVVGAAVVAYRYRATHAPVAVAPAVSPAAATAGHGRRSIAVLGFRNLSGQPDVAWLSGALAEMLRSELAAGETLRLIPAETIARTKVELGLGEPDSLAADTLARVRANLGSDYLLLGSYTALGSSAKPGGTAERQIRLDLQLQDTTAGDTQTATLVGTEARLFDLVAQAGAELRSRLGVGPLAAADASQARASLPSTPEAARFYAEGVSRLRLYDAVAARELLERAVAADPKYPLAHAALSAAWTALGYDAKAADEARLAFELASGLAREERLLVEGSYREATREWDKAVEIYGVLWGFFPDNVHYGLRLAEAQTAAGKGKEALATVEQLRRLPAPAGEDPRIDLAEANAAGSLADSKRQLQAARNAVVKGEAIGARLLVARAHLAEGRALRASGETKAALAAVAAAQQAFAAAGDQAGGAQALNDRGVILVDQGSFAAAKSAYGEVIATARRIGDRRTAARALNNLAIAYGSQGDLVNARRTYETLLPIFREVQSRLGEASVLGNLATVLQLQGDLAAAVDKVSQAQQIFRDIGHRRGEAATLATLAVLAFERGDLSEAAAQYEASRTSCAAIGDTSCAAAAIAGLGDVLTARDDLAAARRRHAEALAMREGLGEKDAAASSRLALALVAFAGGHAAEAEAPARAAAAEFAAEGVADRQASALALAAEALRAQGRRAEAAALAREAAALVAKSSNLATRLDVAITAARTRAESEPQRAAAELAATAASAHRAGMVRLELEARLALGEAEAAAGQPAGRTGLRAVAAEAARRDFRLIARRATAALAASGSG
jgi:tetratricopeptide (TPR) repeat protein/TolB-like protein